MIKFYLLGSLLSVIMVILDKRIKKIKYNFILAISLSWIALILETKTILQYVLYLLKPYIKLYHYSVLESFSNGKFSKQDILKVYFNIRYRQKYHNMYQKSYFNSNRHIDIRNKIWYNYKKMVEFNFIRLYS